MKQMFLFSTLKNWLTTIFLLKFFDLCNLFSHTSKVLPFPLHLTSICVCVCQFGAYMVYNLLLFYAMSSSFLLFFQQFFFNHIFFFLSLTLSPPFLSFAHTHHTTYITLHTSHHTHRITHTYTHTHRFHSHAPTDTRRSTSRSKNGSADPIYFLIGGDL